MKREPVAIAALVVAVLEMFLMMALTMGWISWDSSQVASFNNFVVALMALLVAVVPLAGAYFARAKVTPISDPRNAAGVELIVKE